MKEKSLNSIIRTMVNELISEGYTKRSICNVLLGISQAPRFQQFVNDDAVLGYKVLRRMAKSLGYELLLYPVKEDDYEQIDEISDKCIDFVKDAKQDLITYFDDQIITEKSSKTKKKPLNVNYQDAVESLFEELWDKNHTSES